ncbi:septation protein A [Oceaniradius stylonematis]|jgi:intracellular septation protein|uniref:Inner membrane-spanning protein YciB n=1 Tax=Oceaniradius stylonematis TaxID=2184161 RepID=A0A3A8AB66_9HYPH|nr:septation protein A [Oceaniradius stylonematis]RKF07547.1 septation protein A [Oceaniradius stylonematis]RNC96916.1 MAG: septation protein A [Oricola sp.]
MADQAAIAPTPKEKPAVRPGLKLALEFGPLLAFFFANARGEWLSERVGFLGALGEPIFVATAVFMVATIISLSLSWLLTRTIPIMPLVAGVVVLIFGALTLWLHDDLFIKIKPTIVNGLFSALLLGGLFIFRVSLLRYVFDAAFQIDEEGWHKLTIRWGLFLAVMAVVNEVLWRNFSTDFWVAFKVWGNLPITIAFTLAQMPLIVRHSLDKDE